MLYANKRIAKKKYFIQFLFILISTFPIFYYGIPDIEEYELGLNSSRIIWGEKDPFLFFYDFFGPGVKFPIGHSPFYHFANLFYFNLKYFYFVFIYFQIFIQLNFLKKILKKFKIKFNETLLVILVVFSLPHMNFLYSDDVISMFWVFTFFPVVFYYFIKLMDRNSILDALKLTLFSFLWFANSHLGHLVIFVLFFIFYYALSIKKIDEIFRKVNFLFLILTSFLIAEHIYFLLREISIFDTNWKSFQRPYKFDYYIDIFFLNNSNWQLGDNRGPGNPILIWFCIIVIFLKLFNYFKNIKKNIKKFFISFDAKINILFLIFIFISLTKAIVITFAGSGPELSRDVFFYLGIIIFFSNYYLIKKKFLRYFLITVLLSYSFNLFIINVNFIKNQSSNNFIVNRINSSELTESLKNVNLNKSDYSRIYLSPKVYKNRINFRDEGIFSSTDLINYNLSPFQGYFKNIAMNGFGDQKRLMYGIIDSHFKYINNNLFLDIFYINYLMILEDELIKLKNPDWNFIKKIKISGGKYLHLFERNIQNVEIKNIEKLTANFNLCMVELDKEIDCLLRNKEHFLISNHNFSRLKNARFKIYDNENKLIVLPFVYDNNWQPNNNILNIGNFLMIYKYEHSKSGDVIYYWDQTRLILKLISYITLFGIIFFILMLSKKRFFSLKKI